MLRTGKAIRLGIHPRTLYKLRDQGDIQQVWRGLYRLSTAQPLTNPDLVPIAVRIPRGVVCLISALAYYDLTTQVPLRTDKQKKRRPNLQALTKFAQIDRVLRVMRPYLEATI